MAASTLSSSRRMISSDLPPIVERAGEAAVRIAELWASGGESSVPASPPPTSETPRPSRPPAFPGSSTFLQSSSPVDSPPSPPVTRTPSAPKPGEPPVAHSRSEVIVAAKTDPLLTFMTNLIMHDGHLGRARKIVTETLLILQENTHRDPLPFVKEAVRLASPDIRVAAHKSGAKIIKVPYALTERQRARAGIIAILKACEKRTEPGLQMKLAWEMMSIMNGASGALEEKSRLHKEAILNRANAQVPRR
ncbi:ribosomal protein S7 [Calocera viscosa TUFC12733]|uniref:Ribosomal protein S7 n=1 Tax=Calocera viscosa (strain TUFC12733) TaxID=1330018 RepID=A0A167GF06_CALVF|nr:ribosomal protein S7 [Calocera viscosa TUFC12733]